MVTAVPGVGAGVVRATGFWLSADWRRAVRIGAAADQAKIVASKAGSGRPREAYPDGSAPCGELRHRPLVGC